LRCMRSVHATSVHAANSASVRPWYRTVAVCYPTRGERCEKIRVNASGTRVQRAQDVHMRYPRRFMPDHSAEGIQMREKREVRNAGVAEERRGAGRNPVTRGKGGRGDAGGERTTAWQTSSNLWAGSMRVVGNGEKERLKTTGTANGGEQCR